MQEFSGEQVLNQTPQVLWPKLRDARFVVGCIPDSTAGTIAEMDQATCSVRPGFSFVRGTMEVTVQIREAVENQSLKYLLKSKGIGTSSDVEAAIQFLQQGNGTLLRWTAEVKNLGGLLKAVPSGLVKGAAQKVIEDLWKGVQAKIG